MIGAHLLELAGDQEAARAAYRLAARRTLSLAEQRYLESRAARLQRRPEHDPAQGGAAWTVGPVGLAVIPSKLAGPTEPAEGTISR